VGLGIDDPVWVPTVFTKNRHRLLNTEMARKLLAAVLAHKEVAPLLSDEHFSVDGTLIEAWASMKSLQPKPPPDGSGGGGAEEKSPAKPTSRETELSTTTETTPMTTPQSTPQSTPERTRDRNGEVDFRGQKRSKATHQSTADPQARLYRKGQGQAGAVLLHGPRADGEPLGPDRRGRADKGGRARRARGCHCHDRAACAGLAAPPHARRRQGLRQCRLRGRVAPHVRGAGRGCEGERLGHVTRKGCQWKKVISKVLCVKALCQISNVAVGADLDPLARRALGDGVLPQKAFHIGHVRTGSALRGASPCRRAGLSSSPMRRSIIAVSAARFARPDRRPALPRLPAGAPRAATHVEREAETTPTAASTWQPPARSCQIGNLCCKGQDVARLTLRDRRAAYLGMLWRPSARSSTAIGTFVRIRVVGRNFVGHLVGFAETPTPSQGDFFRQHRHIPEEFGGTAIPANI
jgi:hypothetical protein